MSRPRMQGNLSLAVSSLAWIAFSLGGCGATAVYPRIVLSPGAELARVAVLPFENLTERSAAGSQMSRVFFVALVREHLFEVLDTGPVEAAMDSLHILTSASLTRAQLTGLGQALAADYVLIGSVLQSNVVRTAAGDVPAVSVALKLVETRSGRVIWAGMDARTGADRESLFGWGVERDAQKLTEQLAAGLLEDLSSRVGRPPGKDIQ